MSICWVHMKRKLLDLAWKHRDLRMSWSMCWDCLMHVQKKHQLYNWCSPYTDWWDKLFCWPKRSLGQKGLPLTYFLIFHFWLCQPLDKLTSLFYCYKIVSSKWRSGTIGKSGPLFKVLQTCSIIDYCNILTSNNFREDKWSSLLHTPCTLATGRSHNFLF